MYVHGRVGGNCGTIEGKVVAQEGMKLGRTIWYEAVDTRKVMIVSNGIFRILLKRRPF